MPTLKAALEEVAGFGPGYLISDHGAYWLVTDVLERLEREAPERLMYSVSLILPEDTQEGAIYASEEAYAVTSVAPLYGVHRLTNGLGPLDFPYPDSWEHSL